MDEKKNCIYHNKIKYFEYTKRLKNVCLQKYDTQKALTLSLKWKMARFKQFFILSQFYICASL